MEHVETLLINSKMAKVEMRSYVKFLTISESCLYVSNKVPSTKMQLESGLNYRGIEDPHQAPLSLFGGTELCYLQVKAATLKPARSFY